MSHETLAMKTNWMFLLNFDDVNVDGSVDVASANVVIQAYTVVVLGQTKYE